ncbi:hypothetical protein ALT_4608 [Aspergillus lentulus]|uniref:Uncharacterized protein n=1 Tax=Aspergillus lentulus TaxID=293939 RepID=A0AAN4PIM5_ASPLE|nr:uncharacterized protein IFM58399_04580 [Aspergillus lentulus]KAF4154552.1 hypothetical protein CNMCM6069_009112 [Aspergillus lentulus]KAF4164859.1 hypothetical protein CNMCM6936_008543 [Aspergillus lentulus]KAF4174301.1 hypothetical protein CNMCM8060_008873 [Aspergillus lentulus]KAF4189190.1 hypothetical protein CNMCM7927_009191 [Aspergillus lentulus]KAF4195243.1 hypothetical protein CNMCM8694_006549 [Aspergillus lentulus]
MKINAIVSSVFCLAATQLVAADTTTSTYTHTITKTLVRVNSETPGASTVVSSYVVPSSSATPSSSWIASSSAAATSTPASSTPSASGVVNHSGARSVADVRMPVALVAGSVALLLGAAL